VGDVVRATAPEVVETDHLVAVADQRLAEVAP
jgi:hypothetical protein